MKTIIYILISLLIASIGIIIQLLIPNNNVSSSIATSLIAGGFTSLFYSIIKFYDDRESELNSLETKRILYEIFNFTQTMLEDIKQNRLIVDDPLLRAIFSKTIKQEFDSLIKLHDKTKQVQVDLLGMTLIRFYKEQINNVRSIKNLKLRIIVQDPFSDALKMMTNEEGRDHTKVVADILEFTRLIKSENAERFIIKWYQGNPSIAYTRFNDTIFIKTRLLNEGRDAPNFFERYHKHNDKIFLIYTEYFDAVWSKSIDPYNYA